MSGARPSPPADPQLQALKQQPDLVAAHLVGLVALEARDWRTAFSAFQSVVKLDRDHAAAWAQLARLHMSEGQVNLADAALRETRRIQPDDPIVLDLIATTLSLMGEHGAAQAFFARANTRQPGHPPFMLNLANNLFYHGDTDKADSIFRDIIRRQPDSPQAHWALATSVKARDEHHKQVMQQFVERIISSHSRMRGNTPHFVDKLPQNYLLIPLILAALPNAKIVHLVRDPMDACFASFKQLFADAYLHSYEQGEMARHHVRYHHLMALWRERFPGRLFDIRYEDTAGAVEPNARALLEYLELPWEDACLGFHQQDSAVTTASAVQSAHALNWSLAPLCTAADSHAADSGSGRRPPRRLRCSRAKRINGENHANRPSSPDHGKSSPLHQPRSRQSRFRCRSGLHNQCAGLVTIAGRSAGHRNQTQRVGAGRAAGDHRPVREFHQQSQHE